MSTGKTLCRTERIIKVVLFILFVLFVVLLALFTKYAVNKNLDTASIALFKQYTDSLLL